MDQDATWYGGRPRPRRHCVRWRPSSPLQKGGRGSQFPAHFYCGQTAGCINKPLAMEVGLSPGDFVLDRDPASLPKKGAEPPIFGPRLLWPNGSMYQDASWYRGRPRPTRHCIRWGPVPLPLKGHSPPIFGLCPLWPNGWMDEDAACYRSRPRRPFNTMWPATLY